MLLDFVELNRAGGPPLHGQLAAALRGSITQGRVKPGQKLPSIRRAATELKISRTTVEAAYQQLCLEGYVESKPQSGYYARLRQEAPPPPVFAPPEQPRFDLRSGRVDASTADTHIWQKQLRAALTRQPELISYGDPQGEEGLRQALSAYAFAARGVRAQARHIVIGAGMQPLLTLLLSLLRQDKSLLWPPRVAIESPGFQQAEQVFADFGLPTRLLPEQPEAWQHCLSEAGGGLYLYLPSRRAAGSLAPEVARRKALQQWLSIKGRYIIEDDYNGELRYQSRPLPALQCLEQEGVVYIGSFSKLLLPSIRIAYMVLPPGLWQVYTQQAPVYNQTAGKIEQMALQTYIEQGLLEKHLRRLRKIYLKKSQLLRQAVEQAWGDSCAEMLLWETDLSYLLTLRSNASAEELAANALAQGVALRPAGRSAEGWPRLLLNFAGIDMTDIVPAIKILREHLPL